MFQIKTGIVHSQIVAWAHQVFCPHKTPHSDINTFLHFNLPIGDADFVVRQAQDSPDELYLVVMICNL